MNIKTRLDDYSLTMRSSNQITTKVQKHLINFNWGFQIPPIVVRLKIALEKQNT